MKRKFYLRGLGLGIVVTATIMSIMASRNHKMTDEEIIARAKQLGMIESTVLTEGTDREDNGGQKSDDEKSGDSKDETDAQTDENQSESGTAKPQSPENVTEPDAHTDTKTDSTEPNAQADTKTDSTNPDVNASEPKTQPDFKPASAFPKVIIINSGEGSYTVSKKLKEIGAVESAEDFDTYLCENGYDKKIRAGTYTIPADASDEQMAKIVTGSKITE